LQELREISEGDRDYPGQEIYRVDNILKRTFKEKFFDDNINDYR